MTVQQGDTEQKHKLLEVAVKAMQRGEDVLHSASWKHRGTY